MISAVMQWAEEQQASCVSLNVTEGNEYAIALYLRHGFTDAGELLPATLDEAAERHFIRNLAS